MSGRILTWDPPHVFAHECHQAIVRDSVVRYELVAVGDDTILTFTHCGLNPRDARGFNPGTHACLDRLTAQIACTEPLAWSTRHREVAVSCTQALPAPPLSGLLRRLRPLRTSIGDV